MSEKKKYQNLFDQELPGWSAQRIMSPVQPAEPYRKLPTNYKKASVVLLMYPNGKGTKGIFIKRAAHPLDKHSGQISLPGGQLEGDETFMQAAIREVNEEIGVEEHEFNIIGRLTPLYVFVSNFYVQPYVAWMHKQPRIRMQNSEVSEVLHVDMKVFKEEENVKTKDLKVRNHLMKDVPYFDMEGNTLWGATAMMMNEYAELVRKYKV